MSPVIPLVANSFQPSVFDIARYLFNKMKPADLQIGLDEQHSLDEYITHLTDTATWENYKADLQEEINKLNAEVDKYPRKIEAIENSALLENKKVELKAQLVEQRFEILKKINQYKTHQIMCAKIDSLIHDSQLQELLLAKEELNQYYSSYLIVLKNLENNKNDSDTIEKLNMQITEDHHLRDLLFEIHLLEKMKSPSVYHPSKVDNIVYKIVEASDLSGIATEVAEKSQQAVDQLNSIDPTTDTSGSAFNFMHSVPLVGSFLTGLSKLRDAYNAYKDPTVPQRKTKMGAALFGGLVAIGAGIVGALLLAGVGALATASAIWIAPIVLGAVAVGVASVSLYRDSYILHQAREQVDQAEKALVDDDEFIRAKEIIISNHIMHDDKNLIGEIKVLQNMITEKRHELYQLSRARNVNSEQVRTLKNELTDLSRKRNDLVSDNINLKIAINNDFRNDPRIARIHVQKANLHQSLIALKTARSVARRKVVLSTIGVIAVALALTAVLLTGVGALVVGFISFAAIVGVTAKNIYDNSRNQANKALNVKKKPSSAQIHTSELQIEKELLYSQHHEVAHALIHQTVALPTAAEKKHQNAVPAPVIKPVVPVKEETEGEGGTKFKLK